MFSLVSVFGSLVMMFYGLYMYGSGNLHSKDHLYKIGRIHARNPNAHDKWIVVATDTNSPDDVIALTQIPGWRLVIVGSMNSASMCPQNRCVYLSMDDQTKLGLNIVPRLPNDLQTRKNVGYLHAIANGAKVIYETVAGMRPKDNLHGFLLKPSSSGLLFSGAEMFNAYRHFGQVTLWPRGYPLNSVGDNYTNNYLLGKWKTPSIQQGLVDGNPEVDAIVHLTKKRKGSVLNITFDSRAPPAFVPSRVFSPFNSHNTLFLYEAFWAMFLPVTTPRSISDIWRSYWAQRLLWEIDGTVGFFPPNSVVRNKRHAGSADADREHDVSFKTASLVEFLNRWTCGHRESFYGCVTTLSSDMAKQHFWGNADVRFVRYWIQDLKMIGYEEPQRIAIRMKPRIARNRLNGRLDKSSVSRVQFVPDVQTPPGVGRTDGEHKELFRQLDKASAICPKLDIKTSANRKYHIRGYNILLIISFNNPSHYETITILDAFYSSHFPHIVYCGSMITNFHKMSKPLKSPVTFVEAKVQKGSLRQKCLIKAMEMNYRVDGYLFLSEDTLLNVWTLGSLPVDDVWYVKPMSLQDNLSSVRHGIWHKVQSRNMLTAFHKSERELELANKTMYMRFRKQLWENTNFDGDGYGYVTSVTDVVYIPQRLRHQFLLYVDTFTSHGMFHDIAVPTAIAGIVDLRDIHYLDGHYMDKDGDKDGGRGFQQHFHKNFNYIHPVNIQKAMTTVDGVKFFCNTFLPLTLGGTVG